ncbi:hemerythrin domain-containing protein [Streptomyces sp. NBC_00654]|uniref:HAD family hydrolase n=1 Tax=Streptomyces sp. NBC_00654 TaxID=2975799 RepID=UPI00225AC732|nr:HAD family hydrolase [Streptomyces sp. NBC_00654]MCX4967442.1 hemerythrin domain-containing protein [Streptomyces sp. NBC_00654]
MPATTVDCDVVFFDLRDTLGDVDRPGHLALYRPSTEKLLDAMRDLVGLRVGVITNLPAEVSAEQGHRMIAEAVVTEHNGSVVHLADILDPQGIVINHEAKLDKPDPAIYRFAADQMRVPIERCLFVGENLIEVLAAQAAGMRGLLKPSPPGKEFQPAVITRHGMSVRDSGRAFEEVLKQEHLLGERIFACGSRIVKALDSVHRAQDIPPEVRTAMGMFVYTLTNFADQAHLKAEEAIVPLAVARGMPPEHARWMFDQHDQARAYWEAIRVAWQRIQNGDPGDVSYAISDFRRCTEGFVLLFRSHAVRENDELYPELGRYLTDADDATVLGIVRHTGPPDIGPYAAIVGATEEALDNADSPDDAHGTDGADGADRTDGADGATRIAGKG